MKYYAVKVGKRPGVYKTWEDCSEQVRGFSGAEYKSFKTQEEAENFLSNDLEPEYTPGVFILEDGTIVD